VFVGNDHNIGDFNTQVLAYHNSNLITQNPGLISVLKLDANRDQLKVTSANIQIESIIYAHPFAWYAASINGQAAKCVLDPLFRQYLPFGN
jgi:hypothetical protein